MTPHTFDVIKATIFSDSLPICIPNSVGPCMFPWQDADAEQTLTVHMRGDDVAKYPESGGEPRDLRGAALGEMENGDLTKRKD